MRKDCTKFANDRSLADKSYVDKNHFKSDFQPLDERSLGTVLAQWNFSRTITKSVFIS